ncbi:hypothetical protein ACFLZZ_03660 [Nanoarchaeota archaeon]
MKDEMLGDRKKRGLFQKAKRNTEEANKKYENESLKKEVESKSEEGYKGKILLVYREPDFSNTIKFHIDKLSKKKGEKYLVETCCLNQVLDRLKNNYTLLFLDHAEGTGISFLESIREIYQDLPIIYQSASDSKRSVAEENNAEFMNKIDLFNKGLLEKILDKYHK